MRRRRGKPVHPPGDAMLTCRRRVRRPVAYRVPHRLSLTQSAPNAIAQDAGGLVVRGDDHCHCVHMMAIGQALLARPLEVTESELNQEPRAHQRTVEHAARPGPHNVTSHSDDCTADRA